MSYIDVDGREVEIDMDGYLIDPSDWSERYAQIVAENEGIVAKGESIITKDNGSYWELIKAMREYYEEYKVSPMIRIITKYFARRFGRDKGNTKYLYDRFPGGPAKQIAKIGGLEKPTGCV